MWEQVDWVERPPRTRRTAFAMSFAAGALMLILDIFSLKKRHIQTSAVRARSYPRDWGNLRLWRATLRNPVMGIEVALRSRKSSPRGCPVRDGRVVHAAFAPTRPLEIPRPPEARNPRKVFSVATLAHLWLQWLNRRSLRRRSTLFCFQRKRNTSFSREKTST